MDVSVILLYNPTMPLYWLLTCTFTFLHLEIMHGPTHMEI